MDLVVSRFEVYLIRRDPTEGREIRKTRPCVVISPDEMNHYMSTVIVAPLTTKRRSYNVELPIVLTANVIVAPLTTKRRSYPTRIPVRFQKNPGKSSWIKSAPWTNSASSSGSEKSAPPLPPKSSTASRKCSRHKGLCAKWSKQVGNYAVFNPRPPFRAGATL